MSALPLLAEYNSLVQQHQEQFNPTIAQLQVSVDEMLHQLRQQEQALVAAQAQQLELLQAQLGTDARCLLNSAELQAFVAEVQAIPISYPWERREPKPELNADSALWHLAQATFIVAVRDPTNTVDHDGYDDERTHSTYGYAVTIQVGDQTKRLEVLTHRVYSPIDQRDYDLRDQLNFYVEYDVAELLELQGIEKSVKSQLAREISYLLGCAVRLLSLTPHRIEFHYPISEALA